MAKFRIQIPALLAMDFEAETAAEALSKAQEFARQAIGHPIEMADQMDTNDEEYWNAEPKLYLHTERPAEAISLDESAE